MTVFDLENKLIAHSGTFGEGVREVVSQWGKIFVLGNDGSVSIPFPYHVNVTSDDVWDSYSV